MIFTSVNTISNLQHHISSFPMLLIRMNCLFQHSSQKLFCICQIFKCKSKNILLEKNLRHFFWSKKVFINIIANAKETLKMAKTLHADVFWPSAFLRVCQLFWIRRNALDSFLKVCLEPNQRAPSRITSQGSSSKQRSKVLSLMC